MQEPVLITGAAGFLGHHLTRELTHRGIAVRAMVRPRHDASRLEASGAEVFRGDLNDPSQVSHAVRGCGTVFHLGAARGHAKLSRRAYLELNQGQAESIGRASIAAGVGRLILTSTARIACRDGAPTDETTPPRPSSGYRESKLRAEEVLLGLQGEGLKVVIVRLPAVLGPGAAEWRREFVKVSSGRLRFLPAGGLTHSIDVDDVIQGLRLAAEAPKVEGERFVLAAAEPVLVRDLYLAMARAAGVTLMARELPGTPFRAWASMAGIVYRVTGWELPFGFTCEQLAARHHFRIDKARARLGFAPRWGMVESVARTAAWLRDQGWLPSEVPPRP
jgi:dihydroflavonol-4-reductase